MSDGRKAQITRYLAHSALHVNNIYHNASDEQKKLWLPSVLSGEHIGGMCMSEPGAGPAAMQKLLDHFSLALALAFIVLEQSE